MVAIHTTPNAPRSEVIGRHGDAVKLKLHAPAVEGRANEELIRFLAETLGLTRGAITLVRGGKSRQKTVGITGFPGDVETALLGAAK